MPRPTTERMLRALALVQQGMTRYAAARMAGVTPAALYRKLAQLRRKG